MEREPEAFIEQALDELYEKAVKEGVAPVFTVDGKTWDEWALEEWGPVEVKDAAHVIPDEDVSFPGDPRPAPELDWDEL